MKTNLKEDSIPDAILSTDELTAFQNTKYTYPTTMVYRPRHVLITGGSRGIGLAIAQLFSKNAYRCTLISRSEPDLKAAIASLTPLPSTSSPETPSNPETHDPPEPTSYQHGYIAGDISLGSNFWHLHPSRPFIAHLPKPERTAFSTHPSRIDVVVNCAGVTQAKLFSGLNEEDLESIIRTNLTSMILGTKFLLRYVHPIATPTSHVRVAVLVAMLLTCLRLEQEWVSAR